MPQWPASCSDRQGRVLAEEAGAEASPRPDALFAAGDPAAAAEAEIMLGGSTPRGARRRVRRALPERARALLAGTPPSPSKAMVFCSTARGLLVGAPEALAVAARPRRWPTELDLDELRAMTR